MIGAIGERRGDVERAVAAWADTLRADAKFDVLGPAPYPVARVNDERRYRFAVRTRDMDALREALRGRVIPLARKTEGVRLAITIDA